MALTRVKLAKVDGVWILQLRNTANGKLQEYRCTSEAQAKALELMLTAPPATAPL